jgi:hypothetical protein
MSRWTETAPVKFLTAYTTLLSAMPANTQGHSFGHGNYLISAFKIWGKIRWTCTSYGAHFGFGMLHGGFSYDDSTRPQLSGGRPTKVAD